MPNLPTEQYVGRRIAECSSCHSSARLDRFVPHTIMGTAKFCPFCGAETLTLRPPQREDVFASVAIDLGLNPEPNLLGLLKAMYQAWDPLGDDAPYFGDYARDQLTEGGILPNGQ